MSYAPTSRNTNFQRNSKIPLNEPATLYSNFKEREGYESLAEVFSIIVTLEIVEKAYFKDSISQNDYTAACTRLLHQYKSILANAEVSSKFVDLDTFKQKYNMNFALATNRLKAGLPATVEQAVSTSDSTAAKNDVRKASLKDVSDATESFITCLDALHLNFRAKDQLHPQLSDLMSAVSKVVQTEFEGRSKIVKWLIKLNSMKANEEITDDESRELKFDLETAYNSFKDMLE